MLNDSALSDQEFLRYSRQLLLEDIGAEGQERLKKKSRVLADQHGRVRHARRALSRCRRGRYLDDRR